MTPVTVTPNADTLYGYAFLNMTSEPIVLQIPPIEPDRYYSFQLMDAYTNNYQYLGTGPLAQKAVHILLQALTGKAPFQREWLRYGLRLTLQWY